MCVHIHTYIHPLVCVCVPACVCVCVCVCDCDCETSLLYFVEDTIETQLCLSLWISVTHTHTHTHNDRQPQLFAYARRLESHIVDIEVDGPGATAESRFTVSVQRRNPAQMGVVTGHATYASFYSSLIGMGESTHAHTRTHTHTHAQRSSGLAGPFLSLSGACGRGRGVHLC